MAKVVNYIVKNNTDQTFSLGFGGNYYSLPAQGNTVVVSSDAVAHWKKDAGLLVLFQSQGLEAFDAAGFVIDEDVASESTEAMGESVE